VVPHGAQQDALHNLHKQQIISNNVDRKKTLTTLYFCQGMTKPSRMTYLMLNISKMTTYLVLLLNISHNFKYKLYIENFFA